MRLNVFKSKIHRATVTHADVAYEGSVTIDGELDRRRRNPPARGRPHLERHARHAPRDLRARGPAGSGAICVNGAAAHLNQPGDVVILATFADMTPEEARVHRPTVVRVDAQNRLIPGFDADEQPGDILNSLELAPDRPGLGSA